MECIGKYKEMTEQFRKNGCDGYTIERFIRKFGTIKRQVFTCAGQNTTEKSMTGL